MTRLTALAILAVAALLLARFGVGFYRRQNSGALGGKISRAKAYWLPFALWFWFVLCPVVAASPGVAPVWRLALGGFGAFMWLRGAVELVMLYVTKNWRPPLGIGHDILCIALLVGVPVVHHDMLVNLDALNLWVGALLVLAIASLCVEIHHAWSFYVAVRGMTTGDDGVWFADELDARFARINRTTLRFNVVFTIALVAFVVRFFVVAEMPWPP